MGVMGMEKSASVVAWIRIRGMPGGFEMMAVASMKWLG